PSVGEDAAFTLDQHVACRGGGRADKRDAASAELDPAPHPFDQRARLSRAAAGEIEPRRPIARRGRLFRAGWKFPIVAEKLGLFVGHATNVPKRILQALAT